MPMPEPGKALIERLQRESTDDDHVRDERKYIRLLERHAAEGIRVNVGLISQNEQLKRQVRR